MRVANIVRGNMGRKGVLTKLNIKNQSIKVFVRKGFKNVTMKDICEATNLSRGGLYRYYSDTRQIFTEIINDIMNNQRDEFSEGIELSLSAKDILLNVFDRYKSEMLDSQNSISVAIYEFFSSESGKNENVMAQQYEKSREMWKRLLEYGIERGEFNVTDIDAVFDLIVFSYQGVRMCGTIAPIDEAIPNRIIDMLKKNILKDQGV